MQVQRNNVNMKGDIYSKNTKMTIKGYVDHILGTK